ncbi:putative Kinesin-like protein KIN-14L [Cocos nucifera]|uniref:Putative Kinesin-like protein KIN-14L n=1 Tax=Cocos nucifera TaxID=13894 RepID=A0A8K0I8V9_COCNU|nr:putative Kinesin-like protein KIN-14L [Cocos nucifera]
MAEQKKRWTWELPGFEPRKSFERDDPEPHPVVRRLSVSPSSLVQRPELPKQPLAAKLQKLKDQLQHAREDYLELRQEASDLREYSNAKLDRVTRYLGVLADRAHKLDSHRINQIKLSLQSQVVTGSFCFLVANDLDLLPSSIFWHYNSNVSSFYDQAALETEARISPLINEKKKLFNELLTAKGNVKVFCRTRPLFEDEGPSIVEFPDEFTIRINTGDDSLTNPKKDYEFDRVYGPHVGQGEFFRDVQPFVQSALDGYNVSVFAYGQSRSGKTHTMEGSSHERGLYQRSFEELFDLSNSDTTSTSQYSFYVTAFELYNEQVQDLLGESINSMSRINIGPQDSFVELVQQKVDNPLDFSILLKGAIQNRGRDSAKATVSHLYVDE